MTDKRMPNQKKMRRTEGVLEAPENTVEYAGNRLRAREEDYIESGFPRQQAAVIMLVILAVFCVAGGAYAGKVSAAVLCVIVFIELLMGFFLGSAPAFITVMLTAGMLAAGMLTKTLDAVAPGCIVFIATVLTVKDK